MFDFFLIFQTYADFQQPSCQATTSLVPFLFVFNLLFSFLSADAKIKSLIPYPFDERKLTSFPWRLYGWIQSGPLLPFEK